MELWIRSQDRTFFTKVSNVVINEGDDRCCIYTYEVKCNCDITYTLGEYKTPERTMEVLDEIESILSYKMAKGFTGHGLISVENNIAIYEMPEE